MTENWTINRLADETGLDRRTIKKILQDYTPTDTDGKSDFYKLADFIEAMRKHDKPEPGEGDLEAEQTRLTAVKADIAEVDRARIRNEVIETQTVFNVVESVFVAIRRTIITSGMDQDRIDACLNELRSLKIEDFLEQSEFDQGTPAEAP